MRARCRACELQLQQMHQVARSVQFALQVGLVACILQPLECPYGAQHGAYASNRFLQHTQHYLSLSVIHTCLPAYCGCEPEI